MKTWMLIIWITGCVGDDCQIPTYEKQEFYTEKECLEALDAWVEAKDSFAGICIERKYVKGYAP